MDEPGSGEREIAEQLADAAQVTQAGFGGAADPAADRLHRDPELAGGHLHGHALAAQRGGHPVGERCLVGPVPVGPDGGPVRPVAAAPMPAAWDLSSEASASRPAGVPTWAPERSTS